MPEVGIVMTLRDRISATMNSIKGSGQALSKEFEDLLERVKRTETQQASLAKEMAKTQSSITKQTETVKAAKKEWDALRKSENASTEELDKAEAKFQDASEELDNLKNKLNEYRASTKDARLEMKVSEMQRQIKELAAKNKELEQEMQRLKRQNAAEAEAREAQLREISKQIKRLASLPPPAPVVPDKKSDASSHQNYEIFEVPKGATLSAIAKAYNVSVQSIKRANNMKDNNLRVGQKLKIPVK